MRPSGLPCRALLSRGRLQRGIVPPVPRALLWGGILPEMVNWLLA